MNIIRYLSFEINRECPLSKVHAGKCPISHPERYKFSKSKNVIRDEDILGFYIACKSQGFRGIVLWHMYNEPVLVLDRVRHLMKRIKAMDRYQPFQLTTSIEGDYSDFDIVKVSDYANGAELDNRLLTCEGEGKPYSEMPKRGWCGRGLGWEIPIDNFGNWGLCCNDWRCEESIGNILQGSYLDLVKRFTKQRRRIRWHDEESYNALPRMCRACLDKNPSLSQRGGI